MPASIAPRPLLFFDTSVCDKLMRAPYTDRYLSIRHKIRQRFRMVVSPETFIELLRTLKGGDGSQFLIDKKRIRIAAGPENASFLSFPGEFSFRTSLNLNVPAKLGQTEFRKWFRVIMAARTRQELFAGQVRVGDVEFGLDPDSVEAQHTPGIASYLEWIGNAASGRYDYPPPERWAASFAKDFGIELTPVQASKLAADLDATYQYRRSVFEMVKGNRTYNPEKRRGDWVDGQQLMYLCDPSIHIVVDEAGVKRRCKSSGQSNRVFILDEFIRAL
ncbi:MAG: hypothetical protein ACRD45_02305 [Bryobacteraceae bacterium]